MKEKSKKISVFAPVIPVILVGTCIGISLTGYDAPIYQVQAFEGRMIENDDAAEQHIKIKDRGIEIKADNKDEAENSDSAVNLEGIQGSFDLEDGIYEGAGTGFSGTIRVAVQIKDKKIADIEILSHGDDEAFFNRARNVMNKMISSQSIDVDIISGATYSSRGIIEAVADSLHMSNEVGHIADNRLNSDILADEAKLKDGTYYGTGTGFLGDLTVQVIIADSKIISAEIVSTVDGEEFIEMASPILKDIVNRQSVRVDTVSGATYSSKGIIEAAAKAISQAVMNHSEEVKGLENYVTPYDNESSYQNIGENHNGHSNDNGGNNNGKGAGDNSLKDNTSSGDATPEVSGTIPYIDGVYYGSGEGFSGEVKVSVEMKDHTLTAVKILSTDDDDVFFNRAVTLIDKVIEKQTTEVDTVSGATFSSEGIIEAIEEALNFAKEATEQAEKQNNDGENTNSNDDDDNDIGDMTDKDENDEEDQNSEENGNCEENDNVSDNQESTHRIYNDGIYQISVICSPDEDEMFEEYNLTVKVRVLADKIVEITDIEGDGDSSNDSFIRRASAGTSRIAGMVKKITDEGTIEGIDTVSGATCSSKSILEACQMALEEARIAGKSNMRGDKYQNEEEGSKRDIKRRGSGLIDLCAKYYRLRRNTLERFSNKSI